MGKTLAVIVWLALAVSASAQKTIDRYLAFGPSTTSYRGDLNANYSKMGGGLNVMLIPNRDQLIQTSIELNMGRVTGQQSGYFSANHPEQTPNLFFQTNFTSLAFNLRAYLYRRHNLKVYIGQGVGAMRYVPKDLNGNMLSDSVSTRFIDPDNNTSQETYSNLTIILPRTLGVQYTLKNEMALSLDVNQQANRSDYIDNISRLGDPDAPRDRILLLRFSIMIPILYRDNEKAASDAPDTL